MIKNPIIKINSNTLDKNLITISNVKVQNPLIIINYALGSIFVYFWNNNKYINSNEEILSIYSYFYNNHKYIASDYRSYQVNSIYSYFYNNHKYIASDYRPYQVNSIYSYFYNNYKYIADYNSPLQSSYGATIYCYNQNNTLLKQQVYSNKNLLSYVDLSTADYNIPYYTKNTGQKESLLITSSNTTYNLYYNGNYYDFYLRQWVEVKKGQYVQKNTLTNSTQYPQSIGSKYSTSSLNNYSYNNVNCSFVSSNIGNLQTLLNIVLTSDVTYDLYYSGTYYWVAYYKLDNVSNATKFSQGNLYPDETTIVSAPNLSSLIANGQHYSLISSNKVTINWSMKKAYFYYTRKYYTCIITYHLLSSAANDINNNIRVQWPNTVGSVWSGAPEEVEFTTSNNLKKRAKLSYYSDINGTTTLEAIKNAVLTDNTARWWANYAEEQIIEYIEINFMVNLTQKGGTGLFYEVSGSVAKGSTVGDAINDIVGGISINHNGRLYILQDIVYNGSYINTNYILNNNAEIKLYYEEK